MLAFRISHVDAHRLFFGGAQLHVGIDERHALALLQTGKIAGRFLHEWDEHGMQRQIVRQVVESRSEQHDASFADAFLQQQGRLVLQSHAYPPAGSPEEWEGVRFFYAATVDERGARVGVRLQDQTPLLLEKPIGEGRVVLFTSGFDNLTNDLPLHPVFVAFVERAVRYLFGGEVGNSSRRVDELLQLRTQREAAAVGVEVIDPSGRRGLSLQQSTSEQTYPLSRTGYYEVRLANGRHDLVAANADRRESDLTPIPADVLALWRGSAESPPAQAQAAAPAAAGTPAGARTVAPSGTLRSSLWWYAISLLLILALAESLIGSGYLGTLRDEP